MTGMTLSMGQAARVLALLPGPSVEQVRRETRRDIAHQVRAHCTPSIEAYERGGDILIAAVADWIASPPPWALSARAVEEAPRG